MYNDYFEGHYFKHQKGGSSIAFIPGICNENAFIQVVLKDISYKFLYPIEQYVSKRSKDDQNVMLKVGHCKFSQKGIKIDIRKKDVEGKSIKIRGLIKYKDLTPIKYDIMGIFQYFPMECRHGIISMHHKLEGYIDINDEKIDFTRGNGYIEKDSGTSFPKKYLWVHCSDFNHLNISDRKCSIFVSIADIPFMGFNFKGCICVVYYKNREYRLATYLGAKIVRYDDEVVILKQGIYRLELRPGINHIRKSGKRGQNLLAPEKGKMTRTVFENIACYAKFRFFRKDQLLFDLESDHASIEYVS